MKLFEGLINVCKLYMLVIVFVLVASVAYGQTWHVTNSREVSWEPVTTLDDGSPVPADSTVQYRVYIANAVTDPGKANPIEVTTQAIIELSFVVTLDVEGKYWVGAQAERVITDDSTVLPGDIAWSDDPLVCQNGATFGLRYYRAVGKVGGMRSP